MASDRFARFVSGKGRTYRVGSEIKIEAPGAILRSLGTAGWKVHSRFMVRGHWRDQVVGEGRQLRRKTWIKPFWKGPQDAQAVLDRNYRVKG